jgi:hypothetical protein
MSTVFQAFFVSYLVEPAYEKKIETFDELQSSDIIYGYHPYIEYFTRTMSYPEFEKFSESKKPREDCSDVLKCTQRTITKGDMLSVTVPKYATYVASEMVISDKSRVICYLDETIISTGVVIIFKKGNLFLDRFNVFIRRYLEAGFLEKQWSEMKHLARIRSRDKLTEADDGMFVIFSVSHLTPAFVVLISGYIWSSVVFITELIQEWRLKRIKLKIRELKGRE